MVEKWYLEISNKFPDIYCDKYVIMPNHFHCILENTGDKGEPMCSPLHRVIQWFKTMTTNEYIKGVKNLGWESFDKRLWQRNYYEHIIRNQQSLIKISNYIENNPFFWNDDQLNPQ